MLRYTDLVVVVFPSEHLHSPGRRDTDRATPVVTVNGLHSCATPVVHHTKGDVTFDRVRAEAAARASAPGQGTTIRVH